MVKTYTKKITAFLSVVTMLLSMLLYFPGGIFSSLDLGLTASAEGEEGVTFTAIAGTGDGNEGYASLIDGKYTEDNFSKWCVTSFSGAYIIFSASEPISVTGYSIVTSNDNAERDGRNPKSWTLYGCNDSKADRDSTSWVVIDRIENDTNLENKNYASYPYDVDNATTTRYQYFKLEITATQGADVMQMSEFILTDCVHDWEISDTIEPTCTEVGYAIYECSVCPWQKKVLTAEALGHNFVNGVCTLCDADKSKPYQPRKDIKGIYRIGTAQELYWFAGLVNGDASVCDYDATDNPTGTKQNTSANAVLTADITVNSNLLNSLNDDGTVPDGTTVTSWMPVRSWTPIGNHSNTYTGTFDGNSHTVSGLYFNNSSTNCVGLFGYVGSGGSVSNMGVEDSYFNGYYYVGGVCGDNYGTITNCYHTGKVSGSSSVGGVCGYNFGTITNCYHTGAVSVKSSVGGVCGENTGGATAIITNCYYDSTVYSGNAVGYNNGGTVSENVLGKTTAKFNSGEVAYLLSQGCTVRDTTYDGSIWGQTIGTDPSPVLGGATVYTTCDGSGYSNQEHNYENGQCIWCGKLDPQLANKDYPTEVGYTGEALAASTAENFTYSGAGELTFTWYDGETKLNTPPTDLGEYTLVVAIGESGDYGASAITLTVKIVKGTPEYTVPVATATYGQTLKDVDLPDGFAWQDEETTSVGNAGEHTFKVTFTPTDTDNYNVVEDIEVTIDVAKADPTITPTIEDKTYSEGDAIPAISTGKDDTPGTIKWLNVQLEALEAGENVLTWEFTPTDKDNYNVVTGTMIVAAETTTTTTTTTTTEASTIATTTTTGKATSTTTSGTTTSKASSTTTTTNASTITTITTTGKTTTTSGTTSTVSGTTSETATSAGPTNTTTNDTTDTISNTTEATTSTSGTATSAGPTNTTTSDTTDTTSNITEATTTTSGTATSAEPTNTTTSDTTATTSETTTSATTSETATSAEPTNTTASDTTSETTTFTTTSETVTSAGPTNTTTDDSTATTSETTTSATTSETVTSVGPTNTTTSDTTDTTTSSTTETTTTTTSGKTTESTASETITTATSTSTTVSTSITTDTTTSTETTESTTSTETTSATISATTDTSETTATSDTTTTTTNTTNTTVTGTTNTTTTTETEQTVLTGDANQDGKVDPDDAYMVLVYYAEEMVGKEHTMFDDPELEKLIIEALDIDKDGNLDADDAYLILLYYAQISVGADVTWEDLTQ